MSIIIGADIVSTQPNNELFANGESKKLIGEDLNSIILKADFRIFNLEAPLSNLRNPIKKDGSHLLSPTSSIHGMKALNINLFTLANNHIMDHNSSGLFSTIELLDEAGIKHIGAGENIHVASKPFYINIHGKRYGIYACAEHEFSIADEQKPGANPFDALESPDHVSQMKSQCDYAIVLYHGGKELYRYPSPMLQKTCRKLVENGADLVVCQHSHCIGCKEDYLHGTIIYGQGNFLFNKKKNEFWDTGVLIQLNDDNSITYIPYRQQGNGIRISSEDDGNKILADFEKRSNEIQQTGFIDRKYKEFAKKEISDYVIFFLGLRYCKLYRIMNRISGQRLSPYLVEKTLRKNGLRLYNYIQCEAHRELILKGLRHENE